MTTLFNNVYGEEPIAPYGAPLPYEDSLQNIYVKIPKNK